MVNNSTNIITTNNHLSLNKRKITTFDVGNPIPGLGQAQNYGRVSLFICFKQYQSESRLDNGVVSINLSRTFFTGIGHVLEYIDQVLKIHSF